MLELLSFVLITVSIASFVMVFVNLFMWVVANSERFDERDPNPFTKPLVICILLALITSFPAYVSNAAVGIIDAESTITSVESFRDKYPKDYEKFILEAETSKNYTDAGQIIERYKKLGVYDLAKRFIK